MSDYLPGKRELPSDNRVSQTLYGLEFDYESCTTTEHFHYRMIEALAAARHYPESRPAIVLKNFYGGMTMTLTFSKIANRFCLYLVERALFELSLLGCYDLEAIRASVQDYEVPYSWQPPIPRIWHVPFPPKTEIEQAWEWVKTQNFSQDDSYRVYKWLNVLGYIFDPRPRSIFFRVADCACVIAEATWDYNKLAQECETILQGFVADIYPQELQRFYSPK